MLEFSPSFFVRSVGDAHADPFAGPISWACAVWFVVSNWGWLCR